MTTPNIEELIAVLNATNQFHDNADICTADVIAALQTQAERIDRLEREIANGLRTALEQPTIQNQIVKDISRKPCHTCAHYEQGKLPGVSIYDETCYICREYYANKWEAKSE